MRLKIPQWSVYPFPTTQRSMFETYRLRYEPRNSAQGGSFYLTDDWMQYIADLNANNNILRFDSRLQAWRGWLVQSGSAGRPIVERQENGEYVYQCKYWLAYPGNYVETREVYGDWVRVSALPFDGNDPPRYSEVNHLTDPSRVHQILIAWMPRGYPRKRMITKVTWPSVGGQAVPVYMPLLDGRTFPRAGHDLANGSGAWIRQRDLVEP